MKDLTDDQIATVELFTAIHKHNRKKDMEFGGGEKCRDCGERIAACACEQTFFSPDGWED